MVSRAKFKAERNLALVDQQKEETGITKKAAIEALKKDRDERLAACNEELIAVLKKYKCKLEAFPTIQNGAIVAGVQLADDPQQE